MIRQLILGAGLVSAASAAYAQPITHSSLPPPAVQSGMSAMQAASDADAVVKPGMTVRDDTGATVGTVTQVGKTAAGESAVVVNVDGQPFTLAASRLSASGGGGLVSSMTKAEIKGAPKAPN
jgi:hypothetical protein